MWSLVADFVIAMVLNPVAHFMWFLHFFISVKTMMLLLRELLNTCIEFVYHRHVFNHVLSKLLEAINFRSAYLIFPTIYALH